MIDANSRGVVFQMHSGRLNDGGFARWVRIENGGAIAAFHEPDGSRIVKILTRLGIHEEKYQPQNAGAHALPSTARPVSKSIAIPNRAGSKPADPSCRTFQ